MVVVCAVVVVVDVVVGASLTCCVSGALSTKLFPLGVKLATI